jgi:DNA repair protein RadC
MFLTCEPGHEERCRLHPSNDLSPSPEDVAVTRDIAAAGKLLDVEVLDHLVVSRHGYLSFRQRGLAFT